MSDAAERRIAELEDQVNSNAILVAVLLHKHGTTKITPADAEAVVNKQIDIKMDDELSIELSLK